MNPEKIRQDIRALFQEFEEIRAKGTLTDEDVARCREIDEQSERAAADLIVAVNLEARSKTFTTSQSEVVTRESQRGGTAAGAETRTDDYQDVAERFVSSDAYEEFRTRRDERGSVTVEVGSFFEEERALFTTATPSANYTQPLRLPGIRRPSDPFGSLRDVLSVGQTDKESIIYFEENVFTNSAAEVAEATATSGSSGLKPESGITFQEKTASIQTIAHWIPVTKQAMWSVPEMRSYIEGRLVDGLKLREDGQLLNGNGSAPNIRGLLNVSGVQVLDAAYFTANATVNAGTQAEAFDRIARAKRLIATVGRARASFVVLNPEDDEVFQTLLDGNDHYYAGGPFPAGMASTFWGLRKVVNENIAAGTALVGDGTQAQIWDRMDASVTTGFVNDQFIRNMFTILAEERVGLAVYRPSAFVELELYTP